MPDGQAACTCPTESAQRRVLRLEVENKRLTPEVSRCYELLEQAQAIEQ